MLDLKHIKPGVLIEVRDEETASWLPLTIDEVTLDAVKCHMLTGELIYAKKSELIKDARLRPRDGSCADCGWEAHDGPCVERVCSACGVEVSSRCSQHPHQPVNVYRRIRYLAEIVDDKPFPTQERYAALRADLIDQMDVLRNGEKPRPSRVMITAQQSGDMICALDAAVNLINALPSEKKRGR
jgi:hypothetical protein